MKRGGGVAGGVEGWGRKGLAREVFLGTTTARGYIENTCDVTLMRYAALG